MPDHIPNPLPHIRFKEGIETLDYKGTGRGNFKIKARNDRANHASHLRQQLDAVTEEFDQLLDDRTEGQLSSEFGLTLNVISEPDHPLSYESLETASNSKNPKITLLNLRVEHTPAGLVTKAAIFVPYGGLVDLENKINDYATKDTKNRKGEVQGPANRKLLNNISIIAVAAFDALWTDPDPLPPRDQKTHFEFWIRREEYDWKSQTEKECERLGLTQIGQELVFPDRIVLVARGSIKQIESSLNLMNCLSEVRFARPCSVGLTDLSGIEQEEWINVTLDRISWPSEQAPSVCLLDTGVNRAHPLIEPLLSSSDLATVFADGDSSDDSAKNHGTPMAGLAAYGDLRQLMLSSGTWYQMHRLESVKLISSTENHEPENYGSITLQAINQRESMTPQRSRVFCMAVTTPGPNVGNPSAWSAAIDMAAAGAQADGDISRVILISAGNTKDEIHEASLVYPDTLHRNTIEDPAQAWNAITVGAISERATIEEDHDEARRSHAIAPTGGLSPFTRTSTEWRPDWPISPDIVMEGGNVARDEREDILHFDSLTPLSTASQFRKLPVVPFNATSAATAQASRIAAQILAKYPDLKTETVRGLLVHSARWSDKLLARENLDPFSGGKTKEVQALMRGYGYGVVNEARALSSAANKTTIFTESSLQPYKGKAGDTRFNECHLIRLPWPQVALQNNPETTVTLYVTLSYFIEPNPGSRTWDDGKKYKYASHLLGFIPKHKGHSADEFRSRLDANAENQADSLNDKNWALGPKARGKCGSLVQDMWRGSAADLAEMESIAVFPRAKGWWATRKYLENRTEHNSHLKSVPYSLIISIETEEDLPIYQEISALIDAADISTGDTEITLDDLF